MEGTYFPEVVQAVAGKEFTVYAYFSDGTIHKFEMEPLIKKGGLFSRLEDRVFFTEKLTVMNSTIAWDLSGCFDPSDCIDNDPFTVYESEKVDDPLETVA